jgi:hypothetical protein
MDNFNIVTDNFKIERENFNIIKDNFKIETDNLRIATDSFSDPLKIWMIMRGTVDCERVGSIASGAAIERGNLFTFDFS